MYASLANQNAYTVDAATRKLIWTFDPHDGKNGAEVNLGLTYWEDGDDKKILMSADSNLYALNARTETNNHFCRQRPDRPESRVAG